MAEGPWFVDPDTLELEAHPPHGLPHAHEPLVDVAFRALHGLEVGEELYFGYKLGPKAAAEQSTWYVPVARLRSGGG